MAAEFLKLNHITLTGRVGKAATFRDVGANEACEVSIAVDKKGKKDKDGKWTNESFWITVKFFFFADDKRTNLRTRIKDLGPGDQICVTGTLSEDKWQDRDSGKDRTKPIIEGDTLQIVKLKGEGQSQRNDDRGRSDSREESQSQESSSDDVPF